MSQFGPPLPPPMQSPPPAYFPPPGYFPPPPRQGGGFARAIFNALAVSVLGFSLTLNVYLLIASGILGGGGHGVTKTTQRDGDAKQTVAILPITGVINANTVTEFELLLGQIEADPTVKALVLDVNTPGGEVTASDEIYGRLTRYKAEHHVPVVVSMGAFATSGGYYISCAADQIVAQRTTWTGNIGVLFQRMNFAKLAEKYGVEDNTLKSTGATFKDAGSEFREETPDERAYFQKLLDDAFGTFKDVVAKGRNLPRGTVDTIANGKVYSGPDALGLKLVDAIGYQDDAIKLAEAKAGVTAGAAEVVRYERTRGIFEGLGGGQSSQLRGGGIELKAGGVNVSVDRSVLTDFLTPRPMYLWQGQ